MLCPLLQLSCRKNIGGGGGGGGGGVAKRGGGGGGGGANFSLTVN